VLVEGRNCWRIARADRAAFLIDGDAYFAAFRHAVSRARHSVVIIGWDIDSRVRLARGGPGREREETQDGLPAILLPFLNAVLERRPELRIYALAWDFSVIFTLERETLPSYRFALNAHPRLAFQLDNAHPVSASHHQKLVIVDDALAFAGGMDLTIRRWDTPTHDVHNPERVDPDGVPYPPMHDVHMVVDGAAAAALGEIARARWLAATGHRLPPSAGPHAPDLWPDAVVPDARAAPIGIARTMPPWADAPAVREVATQILDAIAAAQRWIYIENQYLTSAEVGAALARRLDEPDGPEIVAVLPREEHGWLEQHSMGVIRAQLVRRLLAADRHGRLRLVHPVVPELGHTCVNVHAKVMVVDERIARVGSANLSNRSLGVDTECDLTLDADLDPRLAPVVAGLRNRLLAEHLAVEPQTVADTLAARGSLIATIEALGTGPRTLAPVPHPGAPDEAALQALNLAVMDGLVCDPERPAPDQLLGLLVPESLRRPVRRRLTRWTVAIVAVLALVLIWRLTPIRSLLDAERLAALGRSLRGHPAAPFLVLLGYVAGGLLFFPITLLLTATALVFPPGAAIGYCLSGTLASAASTYGVGRLVERFRPGWSQGPRLRRIRAQLQRRGIIAVVAARMIPVGNFSLINIAAGALEIRFRDYMLGNAIGVLPGVLALTVLADRLGSTLRRPQAANLLVLLAVAIALLGVLAWLKRRLRGRAR
jgi:phospholipase D1/2